MIKGIGIDIIEVYRIKSAVDKNKNFTSRIFTRDENKIFAKKDYLPHTIAGMFAAKEAVAKALGSGIKNMKWKDIEILRDSLGKPYVKLHNNARELAYNMNVEKILISISHSKKNAIAQAIAI